MSKPIIHNVTFRIALRQTPLSLDDRTIYIHPSIFMETVAPSRLLKPRNSRHIIAGTH